jgi:transposase-like protein
MTKSTRGRYTLEFKQEAARLVESGQSQAAAARSLGVVEQTLGNWVRQHRAGMFGKSHANKDDAAGKKPSAKSDDCSGFP